METQSVGSLGTALPAEIDRVQDLLVEYVKIGPAGQFGAMMIRQVLRQATAAYATNDVVAMMEAYMGLKACK